MKGFKDSSGKFHPITDYKGVRKSRDQSSKTKGIVIRKDRNQDRIYAESYNRGQNIKVIGHGNDWILLLDRNIVGRAKTQEEIFEMYDKVNVQPETDSTNFFDPRIPLLNRNRKARDSIYRKKLVDMSPAELKSFEIIADVEDNFKKILKRTAKRKGCFLGGDGNLNRPEGFAKRTGQRSGQVEEFCGAVTEEIENLIFKKYGKSAGIAVQGQYTGEGAENSVDYNPIEKSVKHEWFKLEDGTIIDASGGQFVEERRTVKDEDRLRIITPDDPRQVWYNPQDTVGKGEAKIEIKTCPICCGSLIGGKCPSTDVHRAMELKKSGMSHEDALKKVGLM